MLNKHCEFLKGNKYKWIIFQENKTYNTELQIFYQGFCLELYRVGSYNRVYNIIGKYYFITDSIVKIKKMIQFDDFLPIINIDNLVCRINKNKKDFTEIMFENKIHEEFYLETKLTPKIFYNFYNQERKLQCCVMEKKHSIINYLNQINLPYIKKIMYEIQNNNNEIILEIYKNKIKDNFIKLFLKIINIITDLEQKYSFRHGDLKIQNILCDNIVSKIEDLKFYLIDFGFTGLKLGEKKLETKIFCENIGRNRTFDDISFFLLSSLIGNTLKYSFYQFYEDILIDLLYELYDIDDININDIEFKEWNYYANDKKLAINSSELFAHKIKFALRENYYEILKSEIKNS